LDSSLDDINFSVGLAEFEKHTQLELDEFEFEFALDEEHHNGKDTDIREYFGCPLDSAVPSVELRTAQRFNAGALEHPRDATCSLEHFNRESVLLGHCNYQ